MQDRVFPAPIRQTTLNVMTKASAPLILIVDDAADICSMLELRLQASGYRTLTAKSAQEALAATQRERPDLIIMDVYMPQQDGFNVARLIREQDGLHEVPVIAMSAYGVFGIDSQLRRDAELAGFIGYMSKPLDFQQLEKHLESALHNIE